MSYYDSVQQNVDKLYKCCSKQLTSSKHRSIHHEQVNGKWHLLISARNAVPKSISEEHNTHKYIIISVKEQQ